MTLQRKCSNCKEYFPATSEFFYRNKSLNLGLTYWCKTCKKVYDKENHKLKTYGLSKSQYDKILTKQKNRCGICGRKTNQYIPSIDHDHKTGDIRGILCNNCNVVLGVSQENPFILVNAIKYLKKHKR